MKNLIPSSSWLAYTLVMTLQATETTSYAQDLRQDNPDPIEEILVTAEFRERSLLKTANSTSILSADTIARTRASHLSQLLNQAPNVNYASGASRGRFIQIRGVGERSQFIEPLNPSVGILVDGMDLSGLGGAATTLDLAQVEILRGPQGTLFGANALAGLIQMKSNEPTSTLTGNVEASVGDDQLQSIAGVISGPLSESAGYRLAILNHRSDGHIRNTFLNRDDSNNLDELSARGKLNWQANEGLSFSATGYVIDIDNGYDAFSLDNTRSTLSDQPGYDRQKSWALSLNSHWSANPNFDVVGQFSIVESDLAYAFDEDWSFSDICAGTLCDGWAYSSFDSYERDHSNTSIDIRMISNQDLNLFSYSTAWVVGAYARNENVDLTREYTFASQDFLSDYDTHNQAIYTQLDAQLSDTFNLSGGLRLERRSAKYDDNNTVSHENTDYFWGAHLTLEYHTDDNKLLYGKVSRGYKAGGVNSNPDLSTSFRKFEEERMWNLEAGLKGEYFDDKLQTQISIFYQFRRDMQVKQSLLEPISGDSCPCSFEDFLSNAAKASNYGMELEVNWSANEILHLYGSLGLLEAEFNRFESFSHVDANPITGQPVNLDGRKQAHAPRYQFAFGSELRVRENLALFVELEGKDKFKLSTRHEEQSRSYTLLNASITYYPEHWEISLWGRNLGNKKVIERGFGSFGNDPRKFYTTEPYYQYGAPRVLGVSAKYTF
ncbi:MAG: TonB-dependent receptor [Pseudomonadales bacterium]|nr:TonB-dependent receptor [Pseudomonadales bacterium]